MAFTHTLHCTLLCFASKNTRSIFPAQRNNAQRTYERPFSVRKVKVKGSPYSIAEPRVPELIPVLGSQPVGDVIHKPGGRLPLLSTRPAVTLATLKRAATSFGVW